MNEQGIHTETVIQTTEGEYLAKDPDGVSYLLRKWCEGRECNTASWDEILRSADILASLHEAMNQMEHPLTEVLDTDAGRPVSYTHLEEVFSLEDSLPKLDVLYMTRVQKERFFNEEDYIRLKDTYILNREKLQLAKEDMPVLHPLPRVDEIAYDVDDDSRAAYFQQVQNGKYMRMALILSLLGIEDPQTGEKILELGES